MPSAPELQSIYAFVSHFDALATAGQPTEAQFIALRDAGFETVINLAPPDSTGALRDEDLIVEDLGMHYVCIPVRWEDPKATDVSLFFAEMDARQKRERLFVHCIANKRVSAFLYLYHVLREGVPETEARARMRQIWEPNPVWQAFLHSQLTDGETNP